MTQFIKPNNRRDAWLCAAETALRCLGGGLRASRACPRPARPSSAGEASAATPASETPLTDAQKRLSGALMRVNHVGEVCAQALYSAQALGTRSAQTRALFQDAGREECDHLAWTAQRLRELNAHTSHLNPMWYAGAFGIGLLAARLGDGISLGFVQETERQVEAHLASHLSRLPTADLDSQAIVAQMQADEAAHGAAAAQAGAAPLPWPLKAAMRAAAKLMTTTAHYV